MLCSNLSVYRGGGFIHLMQTKWEIRILGGRVSTASAISEQYSSRKFLVCNRLLQQSLFSEQTLTLKGNLCIVISIVELHVLTTHSESNQSTL